MVTEFGLRPLVFHVDGGWNSQVAVNNIEVMIDKLDLDLYTEVIDWEDMKDFQLAFFKSGISAIDAPQDLAFIAVLYKYAYKYNIKYILNGFNLSTECVRNPLEWIYYADMKMINDIRKNFCTRPLKNYPFTHILWHKVYLRYIKRIQVVKPLNLIPYDKAKAMEELRQIYDWQPYPQKHFESRFTRFFEGYWMPKKFGYDTRKVQFSSLILSGQMNRLEALEKLKKLALDEETAKQEFEYVASKLEISIEELQGYMDAPNKTYKDYANQEVMYNMGAKILKFLGVEKSIKR
jgi:tRNA(Ile)-lysidine synthase TilS/MesJ